ncbi:conserved hypothetical protein [Amycolatopsis arida]|uniref:Mucoidy inhibitor MuiA family protein n=1 Tax=Amycolatopsis arida TaxID=587909 RepID=A0A1I5XML1_9PSEU|nr:DUF4139 domain-containing protein [Amycolatopsis arida]TDX97357.1 uncharacterized protein (TIGR02231 family) [Amycolatopsis arida]SFQ33213.1 conserved hypothetical protein [Amycolatopsis arida]
MPTVLDAPIVAVTVYPRHARITRRGRARLAGDPRLVLGDLPLGIVPDSVRVAGRGPATVVGVELARQVRAEPADPELAALVERQRTVKRRLAEIGDARTVETTRAELLDALARRAGGALATALARGSAEPDRVAHIGEAVTGQLGATLARQRDLAERHARLTEELDAAARAVRDREAEHGPDRTAVTVELAPERAGHDDPEVELEVSYVVTEAGWESGYDLRLRGERLALIWHGIVHQRTGEDWPECPLTLSTARPAAGVSVPELAPWFLDRARPAPPPQGRGGSSTLAMPAGGGAPEMAVATAEAEHGATVSTYRPTRPVAVPADGRPYRTTIAELALTATLDHVAAPVRDDHAYLRAVVTNGSPHTLRPGRAALFHDTEFVGTTSLPTWAPGAEVELALGIDDRIQVERELVRRTAGRGPLSGARRREVGYRITVANHRPTPATVTVLDQVPVSRDDAVVVRDVHAHPEPDERSDLGELTWRLELAPGADAEIILSFRVDVGKGVELAGWRE